MSDNTYQPTPEKTKNKRDLGSIVLMIFGWFFGLYVGLVNFIVPVIGATTAILLQRRFLPKEKRSFLMSVSIQAGHGLWLTIGLVWLRRLNLNDIDLLVIAAGLTWLSIRPGLLPVIWLVAYQSFGLAVNLYSLSEATLGSLPSRALPMHILLRVLALGAMVTEYHAYRRKLHLAPIANDMQT